MLARDELQSSFRNMTFMKSSTSIKIKPKHNWMRLWDHSSMGCLSRAFLNKAQ